MAHSTIQPDNSICSEYTLYPFLGSECGYYTFPILYKSAAPLCSVNTVHHSVRSILNLHYPQPWALSCMNPVRTNVNLIIINIINASKYQPHSGT